MSSLSRALRMSSSRMKPSAVWSKFSNTSASCALQNQQAPSDRIKETMRALARHASVDLVIYMPRLRNILARFVPQETARSGTWVLG